ncbi:hypothetical protein QYF36_017848 [Acer negundo]|nr:hypothetical protein QYF36_017848 [Acer negundo]
MEKDEEYEGLGRNTKDAVKKFASLGYDLCDELAVFSDTKCRNYPVIVKKDLDHDQSISSDDNNTDEDGPFFVAGTMILLVQLIVLAIGLLGLQQPPAGGQGSGLGKMVNLKRQLKTPVSDCEVIRLAALAKRFLNPPNFNNSSNRGCHKTPGSSTKWQK